MTNFSNWLKQKKGNLSDYVTEKTRDAPPSGMAGSWGSGVFWTLCLVPIASPQTSFPHHGSKRPPAAPGILPAAHRGWDDAIFFNVGSGLHS